MDIRRKTSYLTSMATVTTRVSSRGQVVIPAEVRRQLQISTGDEMTVEVGPPPERAIVLRLRSGADVDRLLEKPFQEKNVKSQRMEPRQIAIAWIVGLVAAGFHPSGHASDARFEFRSNWIHQLRRL